MTDKVVEVVSPKILSKLGVDVVKGGMVMCSFFLSLISLSSAIIVSLFLYWMGVSGPDASEKESWLFIISSVIFAPIVETWIVIALVGAVDWVVSVVENKRMRGRKIVIIFLTSLFMFLPHWLFSGWVAAAVIPAFCVFTFAYMVFRESRGSRSGFFASALTHALHNLYVVIILAFL